jgi:hypothetical protein
LNSAPFAQTEVACIIIQVKPESMSGNFISLMFVEEKRRISRIDYRIDRSDTRAPIGQLLTAIAVARRYARMQACTHARFIDMTQDG